MTQRGTVDVGVRISGRTMRIGAAVGAALLALVVIVGIAAAARANEPVTVASAAELKIQQGAVERDVERSYEQAVQQVTKVRALNLAITAAQADQIAAKALTDLRALRHSAFVSLAQIMNMSAADAEAYSTAAETRFDSAPVSKQTASPSPVLLAPRYYTVVTRMSELSTLIADQATTQLTAPPPSAAPSAAPSPTARPSASPSPTR
ncbi:MAG TPA: hypothetical protein VI056_15270 [Candidatus Limnocylindria bacterium]